MIWMAWTEQTALFFACIGIALVLMTVLELLRPTTLARGFLPMPTTRGDRFFISLLSAAFIHLFWLGVFADNLGVASALSAIWAALLMRWG
jgi:predicted small integral membrane protein